MLLVLLVMVLGALAALATGGGFGRLADNSLAGVHWLAAAAIGQLLGSLLGGTAYPVGLIGSAVCIAVFLRLNLKHPGVGLLALGFFANAVVVALNGAMPVSPTALARVGIGTSVVTDARHELSDAATRLPWLGDVVPVALPGLGQAVSAGDVLIAAGAGLLLYAGMGGSGRIPADAAPVWDDIEPSPVHPALQVLRTRLEAEAPADHAPE
ncbi:DUF5317 domain-containing protein [Kribbella sp. NPDC050281]|uniref:DUF5317 domain-containing protein n=1 Tax=Kribbella sp. NPDC050281 TaxID=3155515 RepID=UPI0033C69EA5